MHGSRLLKWKNRLLGATLRRASWRLKLSKIDFEYNQTTRFYIKKAGAVCYSQTKERELTEINDDLFVTASYHRERSISAVRACSEHRCHLSDNNEQNSSTKLLRGDFCCQNTTIIRTVHEELLSWQATRLQQPLFTQIRSPTSTTTDIREDI